MRGNYQGGYWDILRLAQNTGHKVQSRAGAVRELLNVQMIVHPFAIPRRIKMRRELGYMEFFQFLCGIYDKETIKRVAPRVNLDLFGYAAIYGPRVYNSRIDQLQAALLELKDNPTSRRAVVMVHDPRDDLGNEPCVTSFQFHVRAGLLRTTINVRSWDLWFGAPHDLIVMSGICQVAAKTLGVICGEMVINAANAHIYEMSIGEVGGSAMQWSFSLPDIEWANYQQALANPFHPLDFYRGWAFDHINNASWVKGAPAGITENWPIIPPLKPLSTSPLLDPTAGVKV